MLSTSSGCTDRQAVSKSNSVGGAQRDPLRKLRGGVLNRAQFISDSPTHAVRSVSGVYLHASLI